MTVVIDPAVNEVRERITAAEHKAIDPISEMHRSGWFLTDEAGLVLRSGVIGMGEIKTPGADQDSATTIECGSDLYAALIAKTKEAGNG